MTTITVYSETSKALDLSGVFGSDVEINVVSAVDSSDGGVTVLRVADKDVTFIESELEHMDGVQSYGVSE